jgi:hypothetical protein
MEAHSEPTGTLPLDDKAPAIPQVRIDTAYERGKEAKASGFKRTATPPEYREAGREGEVDAWRKGWDGLPHDVGGG